MDNKIQTAKDIICYVMDVGTTVTIWETLRILIVENKRNRDLRKDLAKKYNAISFHKK